MAFGNEVHENPVILSLSKDQLPVTPLTAEKIVMKAPSQREGHHEGGARSAHLKLPFLLALVFLAATGFASADVTMQLDQNQINLGDSAQLTVQSSGANGGSITPPSVAGLQFTQDGQSTNIEIINGAITSTSSVTYEVTAQAPGTYIIPAPGPGAQPLTLQVLPAGGAQSSSPPSPGVSNPSLPAPAASTPSANTPPLTEDGATFARMELPHRDLYVGETVPVELQIGIRADVPAALDGLPSLTSDDFTLDKMTTKPEQTEEDLNGVPYNVLTWHSALAAIKPGDYTLAAQTPVTIEVRTRPKRMPVDPMDPNSAFDDSIFQNLFGTVTKKDLNLTNDPTPIKVLPLPTAGQPADFSGAVGKFSATSELSAASATAGDPLTLRLKIKGTGSFDRVASSMLDSLPGWKTYHPSVKFTPADADGYSGEKDFEQAVIPMQPGHLTLPALSFSYFNPESRQYETTTTTPLSIEVAPSPTAPSLASEPTPSAATASPLPAPAPVDGLRADRVDRGTSVSSLRPLYFQPAFLVSQALLGLGFIGSWFWLRQDQLARTNPLLLQRREAWSKVTACLAEMKQAAAQRDTGAFFLSARAALQHGLASRWNLSPQAVTTAELEARLNGGGENIRRVFALADEIAYSGHEPATADFKAWEATVREVVKEMETA